MTVVSNTNTVDLGEQTRLTRGDVPGYDDILTEAEAAATYVVQAAPVLYAQRATLAYTDTTAKELFTLPAGAIIVNFFVNVTAAFDDTGTNVIDLGDGDTADRFVADHDVSSLSFAWAASADEDALAEATVVEGVFTGQNGNAQDGAATIVCQYIVPAE